VIFDDGRENEYVHSLPQRSPRSAFVENFTTAAFEKAYGRSGVSKLNAEVES
jgi:hypothetical protein